MKKTLITREDFKITPWKNGAGMTAEIAIEPAGADFQSGNFEWRLSSAGIEDENTFSTFPGYSRILTVLSGEGLILNSEELGPFEIFEFEGEDQVQCSLIENAVEDLGVIFKRGRYECSMQIVEAPAAKTIELGAGTHFFLSLSNPAIVDGTSFEPPDILRIEDANHVEVTAAENYPVHLLKVSVRSVSKASGH